MGDLKAAENRGVTNTGSSFYRHNDNVNRTGQLIGNIRPNLSGYVLGFVNPLRVDTDLKRAKHGYTFSKRKQLWGCR